MSSIKLKKIGSQIAREISEIILEDAKDSLLKTISITNVDVAGDLSIAKVYFTSLSALEKETIEKEVNEAAGFFRKELAERIDIRHTPELRFIYDDSIEYGQKIEDIIKKIHEQ